MYSNIGGKLRKLAEVLSVVGWISIVIGFVLIISGFTSSSFGQGIALIIGLILAVIGLLEIISTWPLYAFGQMVDDVHALRNDNHTELPSDELPDL